MKICDKHGRPFCYPCEIADLKQQLTAALAERDKQKRSHEDDLAIMRDLIAERDEARERVKELEKSVCPHGACDSLKGEIATLRAGLEAANEGGAAAEDRITIEAECFNAERNRANALAAQLDTAWQQGAEVMREAAGKLAATHHDHYIQQFAKAIRALQVPERKEG